MAKHLTIITIIAVCSLLWISSEAFADGYAGARPAWMETFADPQQVYEFDWTYGTGSATQGSDGKWYSTSLNANIGESRGDGVSFSGQYNGYWTGASGYETGFSLSNDIGDWLDAIGSGQAVIRYTIREDYSGGGMVDNCDVVELFDNQNEWLRMPGYTAGGANLGLSGSTDITALDWNPDFDTENMVYDHLNAINSSYYRGDAYVASMQHDETVYMTWGATAQLQSGAVSGTTRAKKYWEGTRNGYYAGTTYYMDPHTYNPAPTDEVLLDPTFDGTNWYIPVVMPSSTQYDLRMDLPYDDVNYPDSSGAVLQWYDDYDLYLAGGGIANPGGYGVSGRYILERDAFLYTGAGTSYAHHGDVCVEFRTYDPWRNTDGPESPYEWLYDASGDMYVPTNGSGSPTDTEEERAYKLIGNHPYWVDDDTSAEVESGINPDGDYYIWKNTYNEYITGTGALGATGRGCFVDSWRLAGLMLGQQFWNSGYAWDPKTGTIVDYGSGGGDILWDVDWYAKLPVWTWNSGTSQWELPDTYNTGDSAIMDRLHAWMWLPNESGTPVAGYDALNNFMKYVFDIDALVVEDVDGDGEFDVGDDYVLFSVVDDGLYSEYNMWGTGSGDVHAYFQGQYFDGDTIFLYDGTSVTTFFDAATGVFFGQSISTLTGYGTGVTLWSMYDIYDLDALDIGILPEPSTIFLMIGSASGLAVVAGFMRRKLR